MENKEIKEIFERFFKHEDEKFVVDSFSSNWIGGYYYANTPNIVFTMSKDPDYNDLANLSSVYSYEKFQDLYNKMCHTDLSQWRTGYYLPVYGGNHLLANLVYNNANMHYCKLVPTNDGTDDKWCPYCGCRYTNDGSIIDTEPFKPKPKYYSRPHLSFLTPHEIYMLVYHHDSPPYVEGYGDGEETLKREIRELFKTVDGTYYTKYKDKSMFYLKINGDLSRVNDIKTYNGHILYYLWSISCKYGYSEGENFIKFLFDKNTPNWIKIFIKKYHYCY